MIVIVAVVVIGPKDMPMALRTAGRWIGKMRRISGHFRSGIDAMVREAELEEMERKWREQNEAIMNAHPHLAASDHATVEQTAPTSAEAALASLEAPHPAPGATPGQPAPGQPAPEPQPEAQHQLPLPPP